MTITPPNRCREADSPVRSPQGIAPATSASIFQFQGCHDSFRNRPGYAKILLYRIEYEGKAEAFGAIAVGWVAFLQTVRSNDDARKNSEALERLRLQTNLVLEAAKTADAEKAAKNLLFFVRAGFLTDHAKEIEALVNQGQSPVLPALGNSSTGLELRQQMDLKDTHLTVSTRVTPGPNGVFVCHIAVTNNSDHAVQVEALNGLLFSWVPPGQSVEAVRLANAVPKIGPFQLSFGVQAETSVVLGYQCP